MKKKNKLKSKIKIKIKKNRKNEQIKKSKKALKIQVNMHIYIRHDVTNKSNATKIYTRTTTTGYPEPRTCELCSTFKHVLWALSTHVLLGNSLHTKHTNNEYRDNE